ncbi:MAG: hypothetical protein D6689_17810 [Deltaproteobacteria bacterium]|nr:MAG: hypothetical protein D6689_17810 [Deltaproteobacteria bacterium]
MAAIARALAGATNALLAPFDWIPRPWDLVLVSVATGALILWILKWTTRPAWIARARDQMAAAIYEIRLFLDSPRRVFASQGRFLMWSGAYIGALLPGLLVASAPLGLLYVQLDRRHGAGPVEVGKPVVVRVDLADGVDGADVSVAPAAGVRATAPPLYDADEGRVYLRVEVAEPGTHELSIAAGGDRITKRIVADPRARAVDPVRARGLAALWSPGSEPPLADDGPVVRVQVAHPPRPDPWLGVAMPWWLYWLVIATIAALALRKPFGVEI